MIARLYAEDELVMAIDMVSFNTTPKGYYFNAIVEKFMIDENRELNMVIETRNEKDEILGSKHFTIDCPPIDEFYVFDDHFMTRYDWSDEYNEWLSVEEKYRCKL